MNENPTGEADINPPSTTPSLTTLFEVEDTQKPSTWTLKVEVDDVDEVREWCMENLVPDSVIEMVAYQPDEKYVLTVVLNDMKAAAHFRLRWG